MIRSWRLFNFKSVRNDTELPLGMLTVLAGANSSGKSTVFQSMLMVAQSLESTVANRPVVLNGSKVRLGTVHEVRSNGSDADAIRVGFDLSHRWGNRRGDPVECELAFDAEAGEELRALHPSVRWTTMECIEGAAIHGQGALRRVALQRAGKPAAERRRGLPQVESSVGDDALLYEGQLLVDEEDTRLFGGYLRGFLPETTGLLTLDDAGELDGVPVPASLHSASRDVLKVFSMLRYLGPLREEPRALYPLSTTADPTDVGLRGEHTAAVFDLHRQELVTYLPASNFPAPAVGAAGVSFETRTRTLESAAVEWLQYLGVIETLSAKDLGSLGHQLKVTMPGQSFQHDLTHVGTGVSQVLPIVVMCLLAPRDTTLLIEQPELHLHPRVQTLLGDFFLSMAMTGRQVLVETHSEYLVNRMRYRIASSEGDRVRALVKTYFVEKDAAGASVFRPVEVNAYGAIAEWPKGFFDQSQREIEQILLAGARKKKGEKDRQQG